MELLELYNVQKATCYHNTHFTFNNYCYNYLSIIKAFVYSTRLISIRKIDFHHSTQSFTLLHRSQKMRTNLCFSKQPISLLNLRIMTDIKVLAYFGERYIQLFLYKWRKKRVKHLIKTGQVIHYLSNSNWGKDAYLNDLIIMLVQSLGLYFLQTAVLQSETSVSQTVPPFPRTSTVKSTLVCLSQIQSDVYLEQV